ncbi:MAG: SpoIIE family protein phosphatase, partial [Oscillospiraceae bacterium]|nr:SpoIIE family protein phosphatase [Oscillospiraceae bacterium]
MSIIQSGIIQSEMVVTNKQRGTVTFAKNVLDSMLDWVRVIDRDGAVAFMNRAMRSYLGDNPDAVDFNEIFLQRPMRDAGTMDYERVISTALNSSEYDRELSIGSKVFAVISSPLINELGETEFTVEVFRDVTRLKNLQLTIVDQNRKFENDLDMAKMLQRKLLPNASPNAKITFNYLYKPCDMLGGDFVDIYNIGKDHLGVYIADVSGHGVSASILTVFLRSTISKRMTSPAEALNTLYREYNKNNFESEVYITVFYAIYDLRNNILTYSNAGHNATPVLYNKARRDRQLFLTTPGLPISNWADTISYSENSIRVDQGDLLFLYTDGLAEIKNKEKTMFGQDRINEALSSMDG